MLRNWDCDGGRCAGASFFQQRNKARLAKVVIGGKRVADSQLPHYGEADAIRERPLLVAVFAEPNRRDVKARRVYPFQAKNFAALHGVKKIHRGPVAVPHEQKRNRFVNHVFGGQETPVLAGQRFLETQSRRMILIGRVPKREETSSVHINVNRGHKGYGRSQRGLFCPSDSPSPGGQWQERDHLPR